MGGWWSSQPAEQYPQSTVDTQATDTVGSTQRTSFTPEPNPVISQIQRQPVVEVPVIQRIEVVERVQVEATVNNNEDVSEEESEEGVHVIL